jgi:hypothetical protein
MTNEGAPPDIKLENYFDGTGMLQAAEQVRVLCERVQAISG